MTVATSDGLEQLIIWGQGAIRMSAAQLRREIESCNAARQEEWREQQPGDRYFPFQDKL